MLSSGVAHISADNSDCIFNVRPRANHCIHQTFDCQGISNFCHLGLLGFLSRTLFFTSLAVCRQCRPTGFALSMLNLTFVTYFSCDNHNNFFVRSRIICIPRICLVGPICFIENDQLKAFFNTQMSSFELLHKHAVIGLRFVVS